MKKINNKFMKILLILYKKEENVSKKLTYSEKLSRYIDNQLEYAEQSVALALLAAEEAKLAFLEAAEAQKEYDEKYREE